VPSAQIFPDVDCGRVERELALQARGKDRGGRNVPATDDTALDEVEETILERINTARRDAVNTVFEQTEVHGSRLAALAIESRAGLVTKDAREAVSNFRSEINQGRDELWSFRRQVIESQADVERFQRRNRLERGAAPRKA
jgi:hypothetical protein